MTIHAWAGAALLTVLAVKIVVVRWWRSLNRYLPHFGITVFARPRPRLGEAARPRSR